MVSKADIPSAVLFILAIAVLVLLPLKLDKEESSPAIVHKGF